MADDVDRLVERQEVEDPHRIHASRRPAGPKPVGACHYCGEDVKPNTPFCSVECRDDWETEQAAKLRNGHA